MFPTRYVPKQLSRKDREKVVRMLNKSKKLYKKRQYYTRKRVSSFKSKKSNHVSNAYRMYGINTMVPNQELAAKTGCSLSALNQIVKKGEGAYYSSGSRPNQTPQSWGLARLASAITAGKAAAVDFDIIDKGCDHGKKAFKLAKGSIT
jgi:DNA-binding Xre family transcriptional regulator